MIAITFIGQPHFRDLSKQTPIMAQKRPQSLRHREDELPMRKIKQDFFSQMLCKQQRPFLTARWAEVEPLAVEWSEVVVATLWIRATNPGDTLEIVPA